MHCACLRPVCVCCRCQGDRHRRHPRAPEGPAAGHGPDQGTRGRAWGSGLVGGGFPKRSEGQAGQLPPTPAPLRTGRGLSIPGGRGGSSHSPHVPARADAVRPQGPGPPMCQTGERESSALSPSEASDVGGMFCLPKPTATAPL